MRRPTQAGLAAVVPGHLRAAKTAVLVSVEEAIEAMRKAGEAFLPSAVRRALGPRRAAVPCKGTHLAHHG